MNLLFRIVYATHANGTHHKLALDALRYLHNSEAENWQRLFLQHAEVYLEGSKAPDKEFKDFKNHVLHVRDNYWGGAPEKVESWYGKMVNALKSNSWHEAVWAAGIMSHYYTDPIHPFHTAQSTAESNIHRAVEWSISKSYGNLVAANHSKPLPIVEVCTSAEWIKDHVIAGAELSNRQYETLIAHYNFERGVVEPPEGLDDVCKELISDLLAYAAVGHAALLDRAFVEAGVSPPEVNLTAETFVAGLKIPVKWVVRKMEDAADRRQIEAMFDELQNTGTVEKNLTDDDRQIRDLHQREVVESSNSERNAQRQRRRTQSPLPQGQIPKLASAMQKPTAIKQAASQPSASAICVPTTSVPTAGQPASQTAPYEGRAGPQLSRLRDRLRNDEARGPGAAPTTHGNGGNSSRPRTPTLLPSDDLEAAPSIGPKTAARFEAMRISTVAQFFEADPEATAAALNTRHITAKTIVEWQQQAHLVCDLPGIRGGHAQLLVGAGLTTVDAIAETEPGDAMAAILKFAQTSAGQSVLRDGQPPNLEKIHAWVQTAREINQAA
jgi:hypothetical protein